MNKFTEYIHKTFSQKEAAVWLHFLPPKRPPNGSRTGPPLAWRAWDCPAGRRRWPVPSGTASRETGHPRNLNLKQGSAMGDWGYGNQFLGWDRTKRPDGPAQDQGNRGVTRFGEAGEGLDRQVVRRPHWLGLLPERAGAAKQNSVSLSSPGRHHKPVAGNRRRTARSTDQGRPRHFCRPPRRGRQDEPGNHGRPGGTGRAGRRGVPVLQELSPERSAAAGHHRRRKRQHHL